jgi:diguanylate cyclase (GGDEF)-like protein
MRLNKIRGYWFPTLPKEEVSALRKEFTTHNIRRERLLAVFSICILIILIGIDCLIMEESSESLRELCIYSIAARSALIVFLTGFLLATRKTIVGASLRYGAWDLAFIGVSLAWVAIFTGALQIVRPGIEPYLMAIFTISAIIFQDVLRSILIFGMGLLLMLAFAVPLQPDPRILRSEIINSAIFSALAFIISRVVFTMQLHNFRNARIIAEQKRELAASNEMLQRLSFLDPLTNIANRRYMQMVLEREWKLQARSDRPMAVIMIDIDWFKLFNDTYGHQSGDDCLRRVATALEAAVKRPTDLVARYGGEEFIVLLPQTDRKGAICTGNRLMEAVRGLNIENSGSPIGHVTVSMGVASCDPLSDGDFDDLIRSADYALYEAKFSGKNRIVYFRNENIGDAKRGAPFPPLPAAMPSSDTVEAN